MTQVLKIKLANRPTHYFIKSGGTVFHTTKKEIYYDLLGKGAVDEIEVSKFLEASLPATVRKLFRFPQYEEIGYPVGNLYVADQFEAARQDVLKLQSFSGPHYVLIVDFCDHAEVYWHSTGCVQRYADSEFFAKTANEPLTFKCARVPAKCFEGSSDEIAANFQYLANGDFPINGNRTGTMHMIFRSLWAAATGEVIDI